MTSVLFRQIEELLGLGVIQAHIDRALSISGGKGYPYLTYFGVNYKGDKLLSIKVYFTFFRRLTRREIEILLPNLSEFDLNYAKVEEEKIISVGGHGTTFAFKLSTDGRFANYFHYKTNEAMQEQPRKIALTSEDLFRNKKAYSYEYQSGEASEKRYSFIFDESTKERVLDKYGIHFFKKEDRKPYLIEYAELADREKIILAIDSTEQQLRFIKRELNIHANELINYLADKYDLMSASPGFYSDGETRAIYFVNKSDKVYLQSTDTIGKLRRSLFH